MNCRGAALLPQTLLVAWMEDIGYALFFAIMHGGAFLAPFYFTWCAVCASMSDLSYSHNLYLLRLRGKRSPLNQWGGTRKTHYNKWLWSLMKGMNLLHQGKHKASDAEPQHNFERMSAAVFVLEIRNTGRGRSPNGTKSSAAAVGQILH